MSIIAHVDHGKSTLADCLIRKAGISTKDRFTQTRKDEEARGISIKSTGVSLCFEVPDSTGARVPHLINIIDSPGHVDFSAEVTAALRATDGALVVVDSVEGVCVQTRTVLQQALAERIKPVLFINKLDRILFEPQHEPESAYETFVKWVAATNEVIEQFTEEGMPPYLLDPGKGTVAFGSGRDGWGFTLHTFGRLWGPKLNESPESLATHFWGDHWYDWRARTWSESPISESGTKLKRGFCEFVLEPIYALKAACLDGKGDPFALLNKVGITLKGEALTLKERPLFKAGMATWLPAADNLLEMVVTQLPSPVEAQKYRCAVLYNGPQDDVCAKAIQACDPEGPLMMYITKIVPLDAVMYAFGRIYSGTVRMGQRVRIMGNDYVVGEKHDIAENKSVQRVCVMMGRYVEGIEDCPAGNTISLVGIDAYLLKCGTVSTAPEAHPFRSMAFSVSPVVKVAVKAKNPIDNPKLVEAMKKLSNVEPCARCYQDAATGEQVLAATGELHMEICLKDLEEFARCPIVASEPVVSYMETVSAASAIECVGKSPNNLNRVVLTAQPMKAELVDAFEKGTVPTEEKERATVLREHGWDPTESRRIWAVAESSVLVDNTKSVQNLREIKDKVMKSFINHTSHGVLCGEELRGVRFDLTDAMVHQDAAHRGENQIDPATRRALLASLLTAHPRLLEPVFAVEVQTEESCVSAIQQVLRRKRGQILSVEPRVGTPIVVVKSHLPVSEAFHLTDQLRAASSGRAFPQCVFDHWAEVPGDPLEAGSMANRAVMAVRKRKGMKEVLPTLADFLDPANMRGARP